MVDTREEVERLQRRLQETANAMTELERLNRELQDEADKRAGNEEAIAERELADRLRRIAELEQAGAIAQPCSSR